MNRRIIPTSLLILYTAFLYKMMVLREIPVIKFAGLMFKFGGADANGQANLIPFKTIIPYLFGFKGLMIAGVNIVGNIVMLVPFGILVAIVYPTVTLKKVICIGILTALIIEGLQVILATGIFDIDDVILNGLGVVVGYWVWKGIHSRNIEKNKELLVK